MIVFVCTCSYHAHCMCMIFVIFCDNLFISFLFSLSHSPTYTHTHTLFLPPHSHALSVPPILTPSISRSLTPTPSLLTQPLSHLHTTSLSLPSSQDLLEGCHIIVGTPGRLTGLLDSKTLDLSQIKFFILDEADALAFGENLQSVKNINDVFLYSIFFLFFSYSLHQSFIFYSYI